MQRKKLMNGHFCSSFKNLKNELNLLVYIPWSCTRLPDIASIDYIFYMGMAQELSFEQNIWMKQQKFHVL